MIKFQENTQTDARREGWADPHRIFLATTRRLTTAVDWHLKVKNKSYCITDSMQKISSIHKLIQQILGSHELNDHIHFWPAHPKTTEITFSFPEFAPACKKSVHSINSFLRYSHIESDRVPWPDCPKSFLTMRTQNFFDQFLIDLNLYQHAKNQVISLICSGDMVD